MILMILMKWILGKPPPKGKTHKLYQNDNSSISSISPLTYFVNKFNPKTTSPVTPPPLTVDQACKKLTPFVPIPLPLIPYKST
jgi:hypothetical protein